jgi:hypothetical protein
MKKTIKHLASALVVSLFLAFAFGSGGNSKSDDTSFKRKRHVEYCSYCRKEIAGSGTEQFGKKYCDLKCYVDAN